mmetsp:Transcript_15254/g.36974  ORF Transcript_15254/g.36974 Transcript_15254/m.36974 type:complete len:306 (+) Transcript_15254:265-1182(+)
MTPTTTRHPLLPPIRPGLRRGPEEQAAVVLERHQGRLPDKVDHHCALPLLGSPGQRRGLRGAPRRRDGGVHGRERDADGYCCAGHAQRATLRPAPDDHGFDGPDCDLHHCAARHRGACRCQVSASVCVERHLPVVLHVPGFDVQPLQRHPQGDALHGGALQCARLGHLHLPGPGLLPLALYQPGRWPRLCQGGAVCRAADLLHGAHDPWLSQRPAVYAVDPQPRGGLCAGDCHLPRAGRGVGPDWPLRHRQGGHGLPSLQHRGGGDRDDAGRVSAPLAGGPWRHRRCRHRACRRGWAVWLHCHVL